MAFSFFGKTVPSLSQIVQGAKSAVSSAVQKGSQYLRPQAAGQVGKAIDVIGQKLGNILPQATSFGPQGLSGYLENLGSRALAPEQRLQKVQQRSSQLGINPVYDPEVQRVLQQQSGGGAGGGGDGGNGGGGEGGGGYGGSGGGSYIPPDVMTNNTLGQAIQTIKDQFGQFLGQAGQTDPFAFDEALAKNSIIQQYAPYYAQVLNQFLQGVRTRTSRTKEDAAKMLEELQSGATDYTGKAKQSLDLAQEAATQGYEDRGLLFSGQRGRAEGLLQAQKGREVASYLSGQQRKAETVQEQQQRILEDLLAEKQAKEGDIARQQQYDVASELERRRQLAASGIRETEALGPIPGENPTDFLNRRAKTYSQFLPALNA